MPDMNIDQNSLNSILDEVEQALVPVLKSEAERLNKGEDGPPKKDDEGSDDKGGGDDKGPPEESSSPAEGSAEGSSDGPPPPPAGDAGSPPASPPAGPPGADASAPPSPAGSPPGAAAPPAASQLALPADPAGMAAAIASWPPDVVKAVYMAAKQAIFAAQAPAAAPAGAAGAPGAVPPPPPAGSPPPGPEASAPGAGAPPPPPGPEASASPMPPPMGKGEMKSVPANGTVAQKMGMGKSEQENAELKALIKAQGDKIELLTKAVTIMNAPQRKAITGISQLGSVPLVKSEGAEGGEKKPLTKSEVAQVLSEKVKSGNLNKKDKEAVRKFYDNGSTDLSLIQHLL